MQTKRRKKRRSNRSAALAVLLITTIVLVAGIVIMHQHRTSQEQSAGFLQDDDMTQTELRDLGKFDWSYTAPSTTEAEGSIDMPASTAAGSPDAASDPTTQSGASDSTQTTGQSGAQSTAAGSNYEYAEAGFTPTVVDLDARPWYLMLVNRNYILPENYSPELSEAAAGTGVRMDARVSPHYQEMYNAAKADGITLTPLSGHRRISTQRTNFENKIKYYESMNNDHITAVQKAARIILPPGTSEHNAGLAMDIISLDVEFEQTAAFHWLKEHAQDYGFILRYPKDKEDITQITYEPWHWRYVGVEDAKKIKERDVTLEEYLGVVS